jgi:hypothetical protein
VLTTSFRIRSTVAVAFRAVAGRLGERTLSFWG